MNQQNIINEINKQKSDYKHTIQAEDLANSLDTISDDIYSESERFVYELIQNADDASNDEQKDLEIEIEFTQNFVVISHNGREFSEKDINAISSVGKSQKSENPNQTGYKGIGFKSVFGKSDCVFINSNGFCFRYDRNNWKSHSHKMPWQIIPIWSINNIPTELQKTKFGKYPVSTAIQFNKEKGFIGFELKQTLIKMFSNSQIMLFLRNVTLINIDNDFSIKRTKTLIYDKVLSKSEKISLSAVSLIANVEQTDWIIGDFSGIELDNEIKSALKQDEKAPKRLKETQFTNISFAGKINDKGELIEIKDNSLIFTYLPTKINKGFPFLVNADFLTNAPREGFHEDLIWNIWLFEQVGYKSIEWLRELGSTEYKYQMTNVIADTFSSEKAMEKAFNEGYKKAVKKIAFIPNTSDELLLVSDALIEKTGIDEIIKSNVLIEYYNTTNKVKLTTESIVNKNMKSISDLIKLGVKTFDVKDLVDFFASHELYSSFKVKDNFKLINYFYKKATKKKSADYWKDYIPKITFIANENEELCAPIASIYLPIDGFEIELSQRINFVHNEVLEKINENKEIKEWLREIGVVEPTPKNIIENSISRNLDKLTNTKEKSIEIVQYLFENQKQIDDFSKFSGIQLITTQGTLKRADSCYLADFYKPELAIETYLPDEEFFVSADYVRKNDNVKEWNLFFTQIGVIEKIKIDDEQVSSSYYYYNPSAGSYYSKNEHPKISNRFSNYVKIENQKAIDVYCDTIVYSLHKLKFLEYANKSWKYSKIFWAEIFKYFAENNYSISDFDKSPKPYIGKGNYKGWHNIQCYNYWAFQNLDLFPCTNNETKIAREIIINRPDFKKIGGNSLPILDLDIELPKEIENDTKYFNFRKSIELGEYLKVLRDISELGKLDSVNVHETTERIGLVYQALLGYTRTYEREAIKKWAEGNKLLSTNNEFVDCSKLHYLDIDNFDLPAEVKGFIKIPSEVKKLNGLSELIELLGVRNINKKTLSTQKEKYVKEVSLHLHLVNQMPLIALVVADRENKNYLKTLEDLQSSLSKASFYQAEELYLECIVEGEQIFKVQKTALAENTVFYYTGDWYSPVTLYDLTTEICLFLNVKDISKELNVLLQVSFSEGLDWLKKQKYDITKLPTSVLETDISYAGDLRTGTQKDYSEVIGESSEKMVFEELIKLYKAKYPKELIVTENSSTFKTSCVEIIWHRALGNRFEDRDITISEKGIEKYIEVKATKDNEQTDSTLFLSFNEWSLMKRSDDRYFIARVFDGFNPTQVTFIKMERTEP
jgi:hypothetical protein